MPGRGNVVVRPYSAEESAAMGEEAIALLGAETCDVYLNEAAYCRNVPVKVWEYYIGGYQVIKKWLSYREKSLLGRGLKMEEALYVGEMVRRIAGIVLMGEELDANYRAVKEATYEWDR